MPDWNGYVRRHLSLPELTREREEQIREDLALQFEQAYADALSQGLTEAEAESTACAHVPDWESFISDVYRSERLHAKPRLDRWSERTNSREERGGTMTRCLNDLRQDLIYALRTLRKSPGFTAVAVLTLALGIGATTTVFSVVNGVLQRPLPFREPERLVRVANTGTGGLSEVTSRASNLRDWRRLNRSFDDLAGYDAFFGYQRSTLFGKGEPERVVGVRITETFLPMLGVRPALGRNFSSEECVWDGSPALLLTHRFWEMRFASDPDIVGQSITVDNRAVTVVGVLPSSFDFASLFSPGSRIDFLRPYPVSDETDQQGNTLAVIGRLKPGVTVAEAQADLDLINEQLQEADPKRWGLGAAVSPLHEHLTGRFQDALILLAWAVGLVLLIASTNLSNLLLARAASRRREMAVRSAMGASRLRLVRQMLTEALLLSGFGGLLGVGIAQFAIQAVAATRAVAIPLLRTVAIDRTALGFALLVSLATAILFGLAPALRISRINPYDALRESSGRATRGTGHVRLIGALVSSEVALAFILLAGAGLLLRSFEALLDVDLGFEPRQAVAWRVQTMRPFESFPERAAFYESLKDKIEEIPGVESAGITDTLPLGRNRQWSITVEGQAYPKGSLPTTFPRLVSAGYIHTMGIRLIAGRDFTPGDTTETENVILVNETMARRLWPGQDPIGRLINRDADWKVVGVISDVRHSSLEEAASMEVYFPLKQYIDWDAVDLVVRTRLPVESLVPSVRATIREIDKTIPTGDYRTLNSIVDRAVSPRRFIVSLLGGFALAAFLVACLGIYGVVSFSVSQRTNEIGIRKALGAGSRNVLRLIIGEGVRLTLLGMAAGLAIALVLTRLMESLLFGVSPIDPVTFLSVPVLLIVVASLASYIPARRATRVDPIVALRYE